MAPAAASRWIVALACAAAFACVLALPAGASAAQVGVVTRDTFLTSPGTLSALQQLRPPWVRDFLPWADVETGPGRYDASVLSALDGALSRLPQGTRVIIDVTGSPGWESGSTDPNHPPADPADYARFMRFLAGRFAGRVAAWEIWNEEDASAFWSGAAISADAYTALLKDTYPAIKEVDPGATVLLGGLTGNDYTFLQQVYAAGGRGFFDAVGVHTDTACDVISPYQFIRDPLASNAIDQYAFLGYQSVHAVMSANGDGAKNVWMTELGWSTDQGTCGSGQWSGQKAQGVTPADQATFLTQAYHCLAAVPYVPVALWFALTDTPASNSYYGLMDASLNPKPSFAALQQEIAGGDQLSGGCGNFSGPSIRILTPVANHYYSRSGPLAIRITASSPYKVREIKLLYDGQNVVRNFIHPGSQPVATLTAAMSWQHWKRLRAGRHTLIVQAVDAQGTIGSVSVPITSRTNSRRPTRCVRASRRCSGRR